MATNFKENILKNIIDTCGKIDEINRLENMDLPLLKAEEWKYTPIRKFLKEIKTRALKPNTENINSMDFRIPNLDAYYFFFIDGYFFEGDLKSIRKNEKLSLIELKNKKTLDKNFKITETGTEKDKPNSFSKDFLYSLNKASAKNGFYINIEKDSKISKPLIFMYLTSQKSKEKNTFNQVQNSVFLSKNSQATLIEYFFGENHQEGNFFYNNLDKICLEENAHFKHHLIQDIGHNNLQVQNTHITQKRNSHYQNTTASLSGKLIRNNLNIESNTNCESDMYGFYLLKYKDHIDNHTIIDHQKPYSNSNQLYKGILNDEAKGVFNGKIFVRQDAQKTNAFQSNKNILCSESASINTKPQLEIWADDVKCSHGATTGFLEKEDIFYLRSRGISKQKAHLLLLISFVEETLIAIQEKGLKNFLLKKVKKSLTIDANNKS